MLKKTLLRLASKNPVFTKAKHAYQSARDWYYRALPINDKLIVFESFRSSKYADSPRAIYEYMLDSPEYDEYRFIWLFEEPEKYEFLENQRTKIAKHESRGYYTAFARAKYWVVNGWIPLRVQKKPSQVAVQCWHGTPLKRLRYDIITSGEETKHQKNALRENDQDMARYDYFLSPSKFTTKVFTSAFNLEALGKKDGIIEAGYPRNDFLCNYTAEDVARIKQDLEIPSDKKILLYAPTWRDDQHAAGGGYEYASPVDFDFLRKQLGDNWVILFRAHNLVANQFDFSRYEGFIYDVSGFDDIKDLYVISDTLMTDYSSVFFDYAILNRPIIFFMYDLEHYQVNLRGFYISLDELPGAIIKEEAEVVDILNNLESYRTKFEIKHKAFYNTYNYLEDGGATRRVTERIF